MHDWFVANNSDLDCLLHEIWSPAFQFECTRKSARTCECNRDAHDRMRATGREQLKERELTREERRKNRWEQGWEEKKAEHRHEMRCANLKRLSITCWTYDCYQTQPKFLSWSEWCRIRQHRRITVPDSFRDKRDAMHKCCVACSLWTSDENYQQNSHGVQSYEKAHLRESEVVTCEQCTLTLSHSRILAFSQYLTLSHSQILRARCKGMQDVLRSRVLRSRVLRSRVWISRVLISRVWISRVWISRVLKSRVLISRALISRVSKSFGITSFDLKSLDIKKFDLKNCDLKSVDLNSFVSRVLISRGLISRGLNSRVWISRVLISRVLICRVLRSRVLISGVCTM